MTTTPLPQILLSRLPSRLTDSSDTLTPCPICASNFVPNTNVWILPCCGTLMHSNSDSNSDSDPICWMWFARKSCFCPVSDCRQNLKDVMGWGPEDQLLERQRGDPYYFGKEAEEDHGEEEEEEEDSDVVVGERTKRSRRASSRPRVALRGREAEEEEEGVKEGHSVQGIRSEQRRRRRGVANPELSERAKSNQDLKRAIRSYRRARRLKRRPPPKPGWWRLSAEDVPRFASRNSRIQERSRFCSVRTILLLCLFVLAVVVLGWFWRHQTDSQMQMDDRYVVELAAVPYKPSGPAEVGEYIEVWSPEFGEEIEIVEKSM